MRFYGIADLISLDVEEWALTREEAEATLAMVLADEPEWRGQLVVVSVDFGTGRVFKSDES